MNEIKLYTMNPHERFADRVKDVWQLSGTIAKMN